MYKVIEESGRFLVVDEHDNILTRSNSKETADNICSHYNGSPVDVAYPVAIDPESLARRQIRAENRADLARLAAQRKAELVSGERSVEKSISFSALRVLERSTRGESYRVGDEG